MRLWICGKKNTEVEYHFHQSHQAYMLSTWLTTDDVKLDHLAEVIVLKVSPLWGYSSLFPHCALWKEVTISSPYLRNGSYLHLLEGAVSIQTLWNSSTWVRYLFNYLFMSVWTHGYLLNTLGYNSVLHYIFSCSNCSSLGRWELFLLVPVSLWHTSNFGFCFFLEHLLPLWHYKLLQVHLVYFLPQS